MASTSAGPKGPWPPGRRSLLGQELAHEHELAQLGLEPLLLEILAADGPARERGLAAGQEVVAPAREGRCRHAERARDQLQVLAAEQAQHRLALALP
jgi:hypothetical protein